MIITVLQLAQTVHKILFHLLEPGDAVINTAPASWWSLTV